MIKILMKMDNVKSQIPNLKSQIKKITKISKSNPKFKNKFSISALLFPYSYLDFICFLYFVGCDLLFFVIWNLFVFCFLYFVFCYLRFSHFFFWNLVVLPFSNLMVRFRLFPVRSPLLRESLLLSLPAPT